MDKREDVSLRRELMEKEQLNNVKALGKGNNAQTKQFVLNKGISGMLASASLSKADAQRSAMANSLEHKGQMVYLGGGKEPEADASLSFQLNKAHKKATVLSAGGIFRDDDKAKRIELKLAMEDQIAERLKNDKVRA